MNLDKIRESVKIQMELSGLLFKELWPDDCWHEMNLKPCDTVGRCELCSALLLYSPSAVLNPNLFHDGIGFFKVWDAVKDREGFLEQFGTLRISPKKGVQRFLALLFKDVATPDFQYKVLTWLNPKGVEKIMEGEGE